MGHCLHDKTTDTAKAKAKAKATMGDEDWETI